MEFVGTAIGLLDLGISEDELVALGISIPYFEQLAGSRSNEAFVRLAYKNVVGVPPPPGDLATFTALLDSGAMTQAELGSFAALVDINTQSVELVGIAAAGLDYMPVPIG